MKIARVCSEDTILTYSEVPQNEEFIIKLVEKGNTLDMFQYTLKKRENTTIFCKIIRFVFGEILILIISLHRRISANLFSRASAIC